MTKKVWKWEVEGLEREIPLPSGAKFITAALDPIIGGHLWFEVVPDSPREVRSFQFFGTGWHIPESAEHLMTLFQDNGLVWHLYELHD